MTILDLPGFHRVPASWIRDNACASVKLRTATEILPPGSVSTTDIEALRHAVLASPEVADIVARQGEDGVWGENMLGTAVAKSQGIPDIGTVAQYRRLLELGVPADHRALRLASRVFYRLLSRDPDPALAFEFGKLVKASPESEPMVRGALREAATAALAQGGAHDDPRVRGAAHRIATDVSHFLRSPMAEDPFIKQGGKWVLHPDAHPPTLFSTAVVAYMPTFRRDRAGFMERFAQYVGLPASRKQYTIPAGKKTFTTDFLVMGDPLQADSGGHPRDLAVALHWIELLARMSALGQSPTAQKILSRLLKECDAQGVWSPKGLRAHPKGTSHLADFAFPLDRENLQSDVTFRLALIARIAGWELELV